MKDAAFQISLRKYVIFIIYYLISSITQSPIDPDSLLNLAHEFRAAQALQLVSNNDMRHFASMAPIEFEESLSDGMVAAGLDLALRPRFPYFVIGFGVIILLISLISLCTIAEGCRK